jgi:hypothetical protein
MAAPIGNTNNSKGKLITDTLRKVVVQNPAKLQAALEKQLDAAANGDQAAIAWIADRMDGKAHQSSDVNISGTLQDTLTSIQAVEVPE